MDLIAPMCHTNLPRSYDTPVQLDVPEYLTPIAYNRALVLASDSFVSS